MPRVAQPQLLQQIRREHIVQGLYFLVLAASACMSRYKQDEVLLDETEARRGDDVLYGKSRSIIVINVIAGGVQVSAYVTRGDASR